MTTPTLPTQIRMMHLRDAVDRAIRIGNTTAAYVYARMAARYYLRVHEPRQYVVWRHHVRQGIFTMSELRTWMLDYFDACTTDDGEPWRERVLQATRVYGPYDWRRPCLHDIGMNSEEFCISPIREDR